MPSTYAHYIFGEKVAAGLTGEIADIIAKNKQLYYIGLHGPDILFYYKPLKSNPVNALGYAMHGKTMAAFLKRVADIPQIKGKSGAATAYLAGFVCHYALDHACHPYVEKKIQVSGVAHSEIENEFDRFLIYNEGGDLKHTDLVKHINASKENAAVIAPFFEGVTAKQVKKALKGMRFYVGMLACNRVYKRVLVKGCLKLSGKYGKMKSVMMYKHPIPQCADSNKRLFKLLNGAVQSCVQLILSLNDYLSGSAAIDERFNFTFGEGDNWQDIAVLSAGEEDMYEV